MKRVSRRAAVGAAVVIGAGAWWAVWRAPALASIEADSVRAVEVRIEPWGDAPPPPAVGSDDPDAVAALVALVRTATAGTDHKCGDRGALVLKRASGPPVRLSFLPGHDPAWYELRYERRLYRVPRAAFVDAVRRIGVALPLDC